MSTREDVARGAHVGRDSRVRRPCRSRGWKGNACLDPRPSILANLGMIVCVYDKLPNCQTAKLPNCCVPARVLGEIRF